MTKHLLIAALLLSTLPAITQISIGVKTGLLANKISFNEGLEIIDQVNSTSVTAQYGIVGEYSFNNRWSIHSGLTWSDRRTSLGASTDLNLLGLNIPIGISTDLSIRSIDIPLTINYHIPLGRGSFYPHVGIIGSIVSDATLLPQVNSILNINLPEVRLPMDEINKQVIHSLLGVGYAYNIDQKHKIFGEAQFSHALETASDIGIIRTNIKNKGFSVGIGYAMSF